MATKRVLTGMRTTGPLHLGHYVGALKLWKQVQDSGEYECFFLLADVQALTTHADNPALIEQSVSDVMLDWLAVGLDPFRPNVHFVLQSALPELFELSAYLMMIARFAEVSRNPTLKEELRGRKKGDMSVGFMAYPVDQVADITIFSPCPAHPGDQLLVPVGEDQIPHLEYSADLARRFNKMYGRGKNILLECQPMVGEVGRLVGTDGNSKMSKSLGNTIDLADPQEVVTKKIMKMVTDPARRYKSDPGHPEVCPVFAYHKAFNGPSLAERMKLCRGAGITCVECKCQLAQRLNEELEPIRQRYLWAQEQDLVEILNRGNVRACQIAGQVLSAVKQAMHLDYPSLIKE